MSDGAALRPRESLRRAPHSARAALFAAAAASLMLGACAQGGASVSGFSSLTGGETATTGTPSAQAKSQPERSELAKAIEYWGKEAREKPRDLKASLNYARNLKAAGQKGDALQVLQQAAIYHGQNRELASEYGRLALELDQTQVAAQVLQLADDPAQPDWRVISARGTVLAKQGKFSEAIPFFERALKLSNNEPSVLNNLALAHTLSGEPQKAEQLLRQAASSDTPHAQRIRQNLGLVLGVQGRHDEAKQLAAAGGDEDAAANAAVLREMVKAQPVRAQARSQGRTQDGAIAISPEGTAIGGWSTRVIAAQPAR